MEEARATLKDIDHVALNQDSRANMWKRAEYPLETRCHVGFVLDCLRTRSRRACADCLLEQCFPSQSFRGQVHAVEHHLAHLSSAFHVSPYKDAIAVSVDGFRDFASAA